MSEEPLRIAVVGMGKMGLLHSSILNIMPNVHLTAVCERSAFTRRILKKVLRSTAIVKDIGEFSGLDLDAVYVTTPTSSHYRIAEEVYRNQLAPNLFVEKPLASNYRESEELSSLAKRQGGVNMVGYLRRFYVTFMKTKELLTQNAIGEPVSFQVNAFSSDFYGIHDNSRNSIARGGVLRDLGSYAVDIILWLFGDIQVESAEINSLVGPGSEDMVAFAVQRQSPSLKGKCSVSWCMEGYRMPEVILSIRGSRGLIEANDDTVSLNLDDGSVSTWSRHDLHDDVSFWLGGPEYYREDSYFLRSIEKDTLAEPSFATASRVDLVMDEIRRKAEKNDRF